MRYVGGGVVSGWGDAAAVVVGVLIGTGGSAANAAGSIAASMAAETAEYPTAASESGAHVPSPPWIRQLT